MTRKALIVVDYSYDFIADDGRLTCGKPGQDIESFILKRLETYQSEGQDIFFMMDLHMRTICSILDKVIPSSQY